MAEGLEKKEGGYGVRKHLMVTEAAAETVVQTKKTSNGGSRMDREFGNGDRSGWMENVRVSGVRLFSRTRALRPFARGIVGILLAVESLVLIAEGSSVVSMANSGYLNNTNVYFFYVAQGGRVLVWLGLVGLWQLLAPPVTAAPRLTVSD